MFSYGFYKVVHLLGIFLAVISLGAIAGHIMQGGSKQNFVWRKKAGMLHGIGLTLALIAGFGMMARKQLSFSVDYWLYGKLVVWLIIGAYPAFYYKCKGKGQMLTWLFILVLYVALLLVDYRYFDWS